MNSPICLSRFSVKKSVISFGCPVEIAEDYVQEMYIKIHNYSQRGADLMYNETEVNYFFIYVTLKNMYYDDIKSKKRYSFLEIEDNQTFEEVEYSEGDFDIQSKAVKKWLKDLNYEIDREQEYSQYQASLCYIRFIYQKIFIAKLNYGFNIRFTYI